MRLIKFYNYANLGDNIFHIHYLNKLVDSDPDIEVEYLVKKEYITELNTHIHNNKKIKLFPIEDIQPQLCVPMNINNINSIHEDYFNSWIGSDGFYYDYLKNKNINYLDVFYYDWFEHLSKKIDVTNPIKNNMDMLYYHPSLEKENKTYEILFNNSYPMSGQFNKNELDDFDNFIKIFSKKYNIITTRKIDNIDCTLDWGMNLIEIGSLSKNCDIIAGINNSVMIPTLNKFNIEKTKHWFIFDTYNTFSYNEKINHIKEINEFKEIIYKKNIL
jgi:hypothetical protein